MDAHDLNCELAKILGVKLKEFTDDNISSLGPWLEFDSTFTRKVIKKAIKENTLLRLLTWDKGLIYEGFNDGWRFEYKIPATEAYSAKPEILMEGDVERWITAYLYITPEPVPDYCNNWLTCFHGWQQFKQKLKEVVNPKLYLANTVDSMWSVVISSHDGKISETYISDSLCTTLVTTMVRFYKRDWVQDMIKRKLEYDFCPHCNRSFSFVMEPMLSGTTCPWCYEILP